MLVRRSRPRIGGVCAPGRSACATIVGEECVGMAQFLSRWLTMAQVERIAYGLALTTFGVVFVFLITLTILAK
jgi:hypothetical protein